MATYFKYLPKREPSMKTETSWQVNAIYRKNANESEPYAQFNKAHQYRLIQMCRYKPKWRCPERFNAKYSIRESGC